MFCGGGINGTVGGGSIWLSLLVNLISVFFWVGIIGLIIYTIKLFLVKNPVTKTPIELLKVRLAKGEITEAEFERMKNLIQS